MKRTIALLMIALIIVSGWFYLSRVAKAPSGIAASPRDMTFHIENKSITFKDGVHEEALPSSTSKIITRYFGNEATGDFNGDGLSDTAFLISQDHGGTGTFYYIVAALGAQGGYSGTDAILLGDRIAPQTTEFRDREIIVNYADRLPSEPMTTAPRHGISRYFEVSGNNLLEIKK